METVPELGLENLIQAGSVLSWSRSHLRDGDVFGCQADSYLFALCRIIIRLLKLLWIWEQ